MSIWNFLGKVALFKLVWDFFFKSRREEYEAPTSDYYANGNWHNNTSNNGENGCMNYRHQDYEEYDDFDDDNMWQSDCYGSAYDDDDWDDNDIDDIW